MPLNYNNVSGEGSQRRWMADQPLPGPALIIDGRRDADNRLVRFLSTEVEDLAKEMRLGQVPQWRHVADFIKFLKVGIQGPEAIPESLHSFLVEDMQGNRVPMDNLDDLARYLGRNFVNIARDSRIEAANDNDMEAIGFDTASPEHSSVRIFFVVDLEEEESLKRAASLAAKLKKWSNDNAGPVRSGRDERIEAVAVCMNTTLHLHAHLFTGEENLLGLDKLILIQAYRDDDGHLDEKTQIYQAELLLYTLLLYWPESLKQVFANQMLDPLAGMRVPLRPTYLTGVSALEYSARWGSRWFNYSRASQIIQTLRDKKEARHEEQEIRLQVELWWQDWRKQLQAVVPDELTAILPGLKALEHLQDLTGSLAEKVQSLQDMQHELQSFSQKIARLYAGPGITLRDALVAAPRLPFQLKQMHMQTLADEDNNAPIHQVYQALSELQLKAQFFIGDAPGAIPRASRRLAALTRKLKDVLQNESVSLNIALCQKEFEEEIENARKSLMQLSEKQTLFNSRQKRMQNAWKTIRNRLCDVIQMHLTEVKRVIALQVAFTFLQAADLYDPEASTSPYQRRLLNLDKLLEDAQKEADFQYRLAFERLRYSLSELKANSSLASRKRFLKNRKDLLQWNTISDAFLQGNGEHFPQADVLTRLLVRNMGAPRSLLNGQHHHFDRDLANIPATDNNNEEYLEAGRTTLVAALLTTEVSDTKLADVLQMLSQYMQRKEQYQPEFTVLDSYLQNLQLAMRERLVEQVSLSEAEARFLQEQRLSPSLILATWIAGYTEADQSLSRALDSENMLSYLRVHKQDATQLVNDLGNQNRLDGPPDTQSGEDYYYLLLPAGEESDAFLKVLDTIQAIHLQPALFPDREKLIYLRVHRLNQIYQSDKKE